MKRYSLIKAVALCISIIVGGGIAYYGMHSRIACAQGPICDYDQARDKEAIKKIFIDNWYWMTVHDYDLNYLDHILDTQSPNNWEPEYTGKLLIKVYREKQNTAGFVAYYKPNFYEGKILFLAVGSKFRGKHYGEQLLKTAIADLRNLGSKQVWLVARVNNKTAIKFYKRCGLIEGAIDDGFVQFDAP